MAGFRVLTLRKWLQAPEFQALLAEEAIEPIVQAASAVVRWAPAAVARLIRDLDSESANDARRAAREILRLAMEVHKHLMQAEDKTVQGPKSKVQGQTESDSDPLTQRVEELSEEEVEAIWGILNSPPNGSRPSPPPSPAGGEGMETVSKPQAAC